VLIGSIIAVRTFPGFAAYAPTKWALRAFHETLEMELRGSPIRLSLAYPPITDTEMVRSIPSDRRPGVYDVFRACPVDMVARGIVRGIRRGRRRILMAGSPAAQRAASWTPMPPATAGTLPARQGRLPDNDRS
jgi:3-dehydrosphinganine reductase